MARKIGIMDDAKSGVLRTAYRGVVTVLLGDARVFIAPEESRAYEYVI